MQVDGLGGSYGTETLTVYRMKPEMGPPEAERTEFKGPDQSWAMELDEFCAAIREGRRPEADGRDGLAALELAAAECRRASASFCASNSMVGKRYTSTIDSPSN